MENLPKYVAKEWHAWCTEKEYLFSNKFLGNTIPKGAYDALPFPVHVFWATDDELGTERNIMDFWSHVKSKHQLAFTSLDPNELGIDSIGHFGFFKKRMEEQIWPMILNKIDKMF